MKIISTNIGNPKTLKYHDRLIRTGIFKYSVDEPIFLGKEDVENDHVIDRRYHGGQDKACYLYSADHYSYWKRLYPELDMPWGMFGENLSVEGLNEDEVNIGDIFKIGDAVVQVTQPRQPCFKLEFRFHDREIVRKFIESGYPGVYVRVLEDGSVKTGDSMELLEKKDSVSIQKVYQMLYAGEFDKAVKIAANDPFIAESCKRDLIKRWGDKL
jgi:MOSC domain-containing protein YiiM